MSQTPSTDLLLPEGTRLLHIGPQKTGTTALQMALHRKRDELRDLGVVVPGTGTRPRLAVWSLLGAPQGKQRPPIKHWEKLVTEVDEAGDLRVCISTEDWARTDLDGAKAVVEGLGGQRAHIVATARRLDRLFPSQWQQRVKMRAISLAYEEWLERVLGDDEDDPHWRNVWVPHDIEGVVDRWTEAAGGRDRFTLIIADEANHALLPRTFESMLGLPGGLLDAAETDKRNSSIGIGRAEMIRRMNVAYDTRDWPAEFVEGPVRVRLTDQIKVIAPWEDEDRVPALPSWAAERVAELSDQRAELVRKLDVRVVGDPDNLRMPEEVLAASRAAEQTDRPIMVSSEMAAAVLEQVIDAAAERHAELAADREKQLVRQAKQVARFRRRLKQARRRGAAAAAARSGNRRTVDQLSGRELLREAAKRVVRRLPGRSAR